MRDMFEGFYLLLYIPLLSLILVFLPPHICDWWIKHNNDLITWQFVPRPDETHLDFNCRQGRELLEKSGNRLGRYIAWAVSLALIWPVALLAKECSRLYFHMMM
ncbi:putative acyltransferase [Sinorhizobium meliloti AK83]|nr:putative acyltransferase [Sinorhizobium meliloti AK83]SEJ26054.1 hypothetical protein SAMN04244575_03680 [Sinorhizobium meliloti]